MGDKKLPRRERERLRQGREILNEIADQARKTPSTLKEKASEAAERVSNRLKELGKDTFGKAAHLTGETVRGCFASETEIGFDWNL